MHLCGFETEAWAGSRFRSFQCSVFVTTTLYYTAASPGSDFVMQVPGTGSFISLASALSKL